jgi:hypothetical protein
MARRVRVPSEGCRNAWIDTLVLKRSENLSAFRDPIRAESPLSDAGPDGAPRLRLTPAR